MVSMVLHMRQCVRAAFRRSPFAVAAAAAGLIAFSAPVSAAPCGGDFNAFIAAFSREAEAAGISPHTVSVAFAGVSEDRAVLAFDNRQRGTFRESFEHYVRTRVTAGRLKRGARLLKQRAALFARIERQFGVPGPVLVAIWGLESDFGSGDMGKLPVIRVLATMAHDCRRTDLFQHELMAALTIIQRGYLRPSEMRGAYAGEMGQTQFLPSSYVKFAVDYDGDGRPDLIKSAADALASTANFLHSYGWERGGSWDEGSHNFEVLRQWNRALVYRQTIAYFADRLAGRK